MNKEKVEKFLIDRGFEISYRGFDIMVDCIMIVGKDPFKYKRALRNSLFEELIETKYSGFKVHNISAMLYRAIRKSTDEAYNKLKLTEFIHKAVFEIGE